MIKKTILLLSFISSFVIAYSQADSSDAKEKNSFRIGLGFVSNQNFEGRTDSLNMPVLIPSAKWENISGFYVNTKGYVSLSGKSGFDGVSIEPGYEFDKNHWNGNIGLIKNFIKDSSNRIIAPIKASHEFYLSYDNKILSPNVGSEYVFSKEGNDLIFYGGVSKKILFTKHDKEPEISFEPALSVSGGSQTFYYSFLKHNTIRRKKGSYAVSSDSQKQSGQFDLLDTEIELPFSVSEGKFEGTVKPVIESPLNIVAANGGQSSKSFFYISAEVALNF